MSQGNKFVNRKSQEGFSLIELMVVVAIIGILAVVAVPNILSSINKAKQAEAQSFLTTLYTTESSYYIDKNAYAPLSTVGFPFGGNYNYDSGFSSNEDTKNLCAVGNNRGCADKSGSVTFPTGYTVVPASSNNSASFTAASVATLKTTDTWTINEKKQLTNTTVGL